MLRPGELVTHEGNATVLALPWPVSPVGKLQLTNQRVVWVRSPTWVFFPTVPTMQSIALELADIRSVRVIRAFTGRALAVEAGPTVWIFGGTFAGPFYWPSKEAPDEWLRAIQRRLSQGMGGPNSDSAALVEARRNLERLARVLGGGLLAFVALASAPLLFAGVNYVLLFLVFPNALAIIVAIAIWRAFSVMAASLRPFAGQ